MYDVYACTLCLFNRPGGCCIFLPSSFGLLFGPCLRRSCQVMSWYTKCVQSIHYSATHCRNIQCFASMTNLAYELLEPNWKCVCVCSRIGARVALKIVKWIRITTEKLIRRHFHFVDVYDCVICWLSPFQRPFDNVDLHIQNLFFMWHVVVVVAAIVGVWWW